MASTINVASELALDCLFPDDFAQVRDFQKRWRDGTLTGEHSVVVRILRCAEREAHSYKVPTHVHDLAQSGIMVMATVDYRGDAKFETYATKILRNEIHKEWRRNGGKNRAPMPPEMPDRAGAEIFEEVARRLDSDKYIRELVRTRPDVESRIAKIMSTVDGRIGRKKLAEALSGEVGRKVTRHEVEKALEKLTEALRRRPSHKVAGLSSGGPSKE